MHHASLLSSNGHHFTFTSKIISQQINVFIVPSSRSCAVLAPPRGCSTEGLGIFSIEKKKKTERNGIFKKQSTSNKPVLSLKRSCKFHFPLLLQTERVPWHLCINSTQATSVQGTFEVPSSVRPFSIHSTTCLFLMQEDVIKSQNIHLKNPENVLPCPTGKKCPDIMRKALFFEIS